MYGNPLVPNENTHSQAPSLVPEHDLLDELFHALGHSIRRDIIRRLVSQEDTMSTEDLAATFIVSNPAYETQSIDSAQIAATLVHRHLPLLVDYGFVDKESHEEITATDKTYEATRFLESITSSLNQPRS
jgi:hypothetical protein